MKTDFVRWLPVVLPLFLLVIETNAQDRQGHIWVEGRIDDLDGYQAYSVDATQLVKLPDGSFVDTHYGSIDLYTPTGVSDAYVLNEVSIPLINSVTSATISPDGLTLVLMSSFGGPNGTGQTVFVDYKTLQPTGPALSNPPGTVGPPAGMIGMISVAGNPVMFQLQSPTNDLSGTNNWVVIIDFSVAPPAIRGSYHVQGSNANGVNPVLAAGTSNASKMKYTKPSQLTTNDLSSVTLYGTMENGGTTNAGLLYKIQGDGTGYQVLHNFTNGTMDGAYPLGNVIISGSTLYGTTSSGGTNHNGVIYSINTDGSNFQILAAPPFASNSPSSFRGELLLVGDTLYGTSRQGPAGNNFGTVYSIKTNGTALTVLYQFAPLSAGTNSQGLHTNYIGANPVTGLVISSNNLVGTTSTGGAYGYGTVFALPFAPPLIATNPASQWLSFGDTAVFSVVADGIMPYAYQWQFNGTNISNATNSIYWVNGTNGFTSSNQLGGYSVVVTNVYGSTTSSVANLSLSLITNDSFEADSFAGWTKTGMTNSFVTSGNPNAYSGKYVAYLGENSTNLSYLSQTLATVAGQTYLLSFWLDTWQVAASNEFQVFWDGQTYFDGVNMPAGTNIVSGANPPYGWMQMQFAVLATTANTTFGFGFQTGRNIHYFVLDQVNVSPTLSPSVVLQSAAVVNQNLSFNLATLVNNTYQLQFTASLSSPNWVNVGGPITATSNLVSLSIPLTNAQAFYRVVAGH